MEHNIPDGFAVFSFPEAYRPKLRTTNDHERVNREVKRRTQVASLFPNEASCLRLITAVLMEISEDWETRQNAYINIENVTSSLRNESQS